MTTILSLPFEILLEIFHQLDPLNDLQSIAFIPQLRPYLGNLLCFITDYNLKLVTQWTGKYDYYIIEYKNQALDQLKEVITELKGLRHRVVSRESFLPIGIFENEVFNENESGLEGIYFDKVEKIGRDNWYEVLGDQYFSCKTIRFAKCKEMKIAICSKDFPMMSFECPFLEKLDIKLLNGKISLEFLKKFKNLKELRIYSDDVIFGFRFLKLPKLKTMVLCGESLELGFFGCEFPQLKTLDIRRLKEMLIILDTKFGPELEELDLSHTSMIFPITLNIKSLKKLNINNYHINEELDEKSLKLKLNRLEKIETIELSTFNILKYHSNLCQSLKQVTFDRDKSICEKFEYEEVGILMSLKFQQLESLVIKIKEPGTYNFSNIHKISNRLKSVILIMDGTEDQYNLNLADSNPGIKTHLLFSPQRKKRKSV